MQSGILLKSRLGVEVADLLAAAILLTTVQAAVHNPDTDWFRDTRWGVFVHYLWDVQNAGQRTNSLGRATAWGECVKEFDTEKFAEQIKEAGAEYVFFTMMQRTRYLIAPNATYDRLTGYKPGEACSTRDLVEDLYHSLDKRGIKLMLYWTGDGPREDAQAARGMGGWNGKVSEEYVRNWAEVAAEYSKRYGEGVRGWWVDGCYESIGYNQKRWGIMAAALKSGNPQAIVALNNPQMTRSNSSTTNDDFTTGEQESFSEVPDSRWRDGVQWHVLSYLGPAWGAPGLKCSADDLAHYVSAVNAAGGVVTIDVALFRDGSIDAQQLAALKAVRDATGRKPGKMRAAEAAHGSASTAETPVQPDARMQWWRDARFGMFIHWDMSSLVGTEISWSRKGSKPLDITGDPAGYIADPAYDHLYERFNPTNFNPKQWVKLAQAAGMKYIVFTAKHHGGFCMWDTKLTDYSIMHTPFHRDVVIELADACHAAGMPFGLYYSPRDWHQPDYGLGDNRKYVDYMNGQLRELLTHYGKIDVLWFDSYGTGDLVNFWRIGETFDLIESLQPGILINNRLAVLGSYNQQPAPYVGDFDTPEERVGAFQNNRPWESCMCVVRAEGGGWSYRPDGKVKSVEECIRMLVNCATGDGNLLLDVGPDSLGEIPADQADRLLEMGKWLREYGDSIYGTRGGPYHNGEWGGATYRGNTIYLHVSKWNGGQLRLPALKSRILKCTLLSKLPDGSVKCEQAGGGITFTLPIQKQDQIETLLELQLDGAAAGEFVDGKAIATQTGK